MKLNNFANRIFNIIFPIPYVRNFFIYLFFKKLFFIKTRFYFKLDLAGILAISHSFLVTAFLFSLIPNVNLSEIDKFTNYRAKGGVLISHFLKQIRLAILPYIIIGYLLAIIGYFLNKFQKRNTREKIFRPATKKEWDKWNKLNGK